MTYKLELDLSSFHADWQKAIEEIVHDGDIAARGAAEDGVRAAQESHPYTDRTYNLSASAHTEPADEDHASGAGGGADMVWPAEYASYVNDGTERSKAYPFAPVATAAAEKSLVARLEKIDR